MNSRVKQLWIDKLRSLPPERQGRFQLHTADGLMCCLGVLCEIAVDEGVVERYEPVPMTDNRGRYSYKDVEIHSGARRSEAIVLPILVYEWAELTSTDPDIDRYPASYWNDTRGASFAQIADLIEKHL